MRTVLSRLALASRSLTTSVPPLSLFQRSNPSIIRKMSSITEPVLKQRVKLSLIQLASGSDKKANLDSAASHVARAASLGAKIVVLPECFNSPYGTDHFPQYAETLQPSPPSNDAAPSYHALSAMAADNKVYLVDILSPGNKVTLVDLPEYGKIAVAICYDVRFPELATIAARKGAFALIYPGAFNTTTGPLHWQLLALCSPARAETGYPAYGHSLVADPMAQVQVEADEKETTVDWELDPEKITEARKNIPLNTQRRFDVYPDVSEGKIQFEEP
ncbi:Omega-amidase nit3 [Fusarium oxysporum]|nr:Omega-amidase nit3 [Fusarium oxysporum]